MIKLLLIILCIILCLLACDRLQEPQKTEESAETAEISSPSAKEELPADSPSFVPTFRK